MRWLILVLIVVFAILCGILARMPAADSDSPGSVFHQELNDGRTVLCVYYRGLSCDWDNAR